jgi:flagellar hook-basal body complex protein FliE
MAGIEGPRLAGVPGSAGADSLIGRLRGRSEEGASSGGPPGNFASLFTDAIRRVEHTQREAAEGVDRLLRGEEEELHKVALANQRADLTFQYFLQTRNKLVQAYQEIMRMPL